MTTEGSVAVDGRQRTRGIIWFLVLAFGLAWAPFLLAVTSPGASGASLILMPFAPAIACFVVRKWITREGFGDAGLRLNLRYWPLYLLALLWPLAASLARVLLALAMGDAPPHFTIPWGLAGPSAPSLLIWALGSIALAPLIFGEEFGWRGYLQLRLQADKPLLAAVATGLIWGVWHYPLILIGAEPTTHPLLTLIVFPLGTVTFAIFLGWLRLRSGSIWTASVAHAANNGTEDNLGRLAFTGHVDGSYPGSSMGPSMLGEAIVLVGVVAIDGLLRRRHGRILTDDASALPAAA